MLASVYEELPFFLETELTNGETVIAPIADSGPIIGFSREREAYEVSEKIYIISIHSICIQGKRIQKTSNHLLKVPNNGS